MTINERLDEIERRKIREEREWRSKLVQQQQRQQRIIQRERNIRKMRGVR